MKTNNITALALTLSIALAGSLTAAPRSKHSGMKYPHQHGAQQACKTSVKHTMLKYIGPRSKRRPNPNLAKN